MKTIRPPPQGNEGDGEGRHNEPGCDGSFRPMRNPGNDYEEDGIDALVCPECGAWRHVADMDEEPDGYAEAGR